MGTGISVISYNRPRLYIVFAVSKYIALRMQHIVPAAANAFRVVRVDDPCKTESIPRRRILLNIPAGKPSLAPKAQTSLHHAAQPHIIRAKRPIPAARCR